LWLLLQQLSLNNYYGSEEQWSTEFVQIIQTTDASTAIPFQTIQNDMFLMSMVERCWIQLLI
jgi:hypothetical protein